MRGKTHPTSWRCRAVQRHQIRRARRIAGRSVLYVEHCLNPAYFPGILDFDLELWRHDALHVSVEVSA